MRTEALILFLAVQSVQTFHGLPAESVRKLDKSTAHGNSQKESDTSAAQQNLAGQSHQRRSSVSQQDNLSAKTDGLHKRNINNSEHSSDSDLPKTRDRDPVKKSKKTNLGRPAAADTSKTNIPLAAIFHPFLGNKSLNFAEYSKTKLQKPSSTSGETATKRKEPFDARLNTNTNGSTTAMPHHILGAYYATPKSYVRHRTVSGYKTQSGGFSLNDLMSHDQSSAERRRERKRGRRRRKSKTRKREHQKRKKRHRKRFSGDEYEGDNENQHMVAGKPVMSIAMAGGGGYERLDKLEQGTVNDNVKQTPRLYENFRVEGSQVNPGQTTFPAVKGSAASGGETVIAAKVVGSPGHQKSTQVDSSVDTHERSSGFDEENDGMEGYSIVTPPPAFGLFATVQELVLTVKALYEQQGQDRKRLLSLERRYRSQGNELQDAQQEIKDATKNLNILASTLSGLDVTCRETKEGMAALQNKHRRFTRIIGGLKLEHRKMSRETRDLSEMCENRIRTLKNKHNSDTATLQNDVRLAKKDIGVFHRDVRSLKKSLENVRKHASSRTKKMSKLGEELKGVVGAVEDLEKNVSQIHKTLQDHQNNQDSLEDEIGEIQFALIMSSDPEIPQKLQDQAVDEETDIIVDDLGKVRKSRHLPVSTQKPNEQADQARTDEKQYLLYSADVQADKRSNQDLLSSSASKFVSDSEVQVHSRTPETFTSHATAVERIVTKMLKSSGQTISECIKSSLSTPDISPPFSLSRPHDDTRLQISGNVPDLSSTFASHVLSDLFNSDEVLFSEIRSQDGVSLTSETSTLSEASPSSVAEILSSLSQSEAAISSFHTNHVNSHPSSSAFSSQQTLSPSKVTTNLASLMTSSDLDEGSTFSASSSSSPTTQISESGYFLNVDPSMSLVASSDSVYESSAILHGATPTLSHGYSKKEFHTVNIEPSPSIWKSPIQPDSETSKTRSTSSNLHLEKKPKTSVIFPSSSSLDVLPLSFSALPGHATTSSEPLTSDLIFSATYLETNHPDFRKVTDTVSSPAKFTPQSSYATYNLLSVTSQLLSDAPESYQITEDLKFDPALSTGILFSHGQISSLPDGIESESPSYFTASQLESSAFTQFQPSANFVTEVSSDSATVTETSAAVFERATGNSYLEILGNTESLPQNTTDGSSEGALETELPRNEYIGHINRLEERIRILEYSMSKMTATNVSELQDDMETLVLNKTLELQRQLDEQKVATENQTLTLTEELQQKARDIQDIRNLAARTSVMLGQLANQVSAINMGEFIAKLQESLGNFTQNVLTLDQWKISNDQIVNATIENELRIARVTDTVMDTSRSVTKLHDRVSAVSSMGQRLYRSLQGHVIRLNNTVQDLREHVTELDDVAKTQPAGYGVPNQSETQAKLDSLNIQLLYNANRLSTLETKMLNQSLSQCRRSTMELQQASKLLRLDASHEETRRELDLLQEKVKRVDLNLFRAHSVIKMYDRTMNQLQSDVIDLQPMTNLVHGLQNEVDNLIFNVPQDCHEYFQRGFSKSGVYVIYPKHIDKTVRVYCIMEIPNRIISECNCNCDRCLPNGGADSNVKIPYGGNHDEIKPSKEEHQKRRGDISNDEEDIKEGGEINDGGWTVLQRRLSGKVNFTRSWSEYAAGFGGAFEEYWAGNDVIHLITNQKNYELRIVMEDIFSGMWEARYDHFKVSDKEDNYRIHISGYHGNASDGMSYSDKMAFSTSDKDNDASSSHCAMYNGGGWWYSHCHVSNLNGPFDLGMVWFNRAWQDWLQMKSSVMMVRPKP